MLKSGCWKSFEYFWDWIENNSLTGSASWPETTGKDAAECDIWFFEDENGMTCGWKTVCCMAPDVGAADVEGGGVMDKVLSEISSVSIAKYII